MESNKVSVIVPVYKVEEYLEVCVDSIINQTYENLEIILVDDGSPDTCPQLCEQLKEKDKRVKVIHKKNGGLSDARNCGLEHSTGEYILYVDSDDSIELDLIENLVSLASLNNADIAVSTFRFPKENDPSKLRLSKQVICGDSIDMLDIIYQNGLWQAWAKLIKINIAKNNPFKKGLIYEDYDNTPLIFLEAKKAILSMDGRYIYTIRDNSIMGERKISYSTDFIDITKKNWVLFKNSKISNNNVMKMQKHLLANLISMYNTIIKNQTNSSNMIFMEQTQDFVKQHIHEWIRNEYISSARKGAYIALAYMPAVYNIIAKYA